MSRSRVGTAQDQPAPQAVRVVMTVSIRRTGGCGTLAWPGLDLCPLPEEQESLFWAFAVGAALYTALLLAV